MPRTSDARQKMIESAAVLFRERGVHGTSFGDVLAHSGAPRGSVYHHFKGGKTQIAEEALRWSGEVMLAGIVATLEAHADEPAAAIGAWCDGWAQLLEESDYAAGCSFVAAVQDGGHEPTARAIAGEAFAGWERVIGDAFREHGVASSRADALATLLIAAVEGAVLIARAQRSLVPLRRVSAQLQQVAVDALADAGD